MAFNAANLSLMAQANGFGLYRYDTLDVLTDVDDNGYMNNSDDTVNLRVGDIIEVVVWATAIRTGTISDVGRHIVYGVSAAGVVNLSNDLTGWGITSGD
jgi:hypothetical protein